MSDINTKNRRQDVDDDGMRTAPTPIGSSTHFLPAIHQEFVLEPSLAIDNPNVRKEVDASTALDLQPKAKDINRKWKREKRNKNRIVGAIMFLLSAVVILPYILGIFDQELTFLPFKYTLTQFNAIKNIIDACKLTMEFGAGNELVNAIWLYAVPSLMLAFGLLFVIFNMIKSVFGIFGAIRPRRYIGTSAIYLLVVVALLICSLVGAEAIGIAKIDFMSDVIYGFKTSELFSLIVFGLGNLLFAIFCAVVTPIRSGYTR